MVQPEGFNIPYDAEQIHGISTSLAQAEGIALESMLDKFQGALKKSRFVVGQNVGFDINVMGCEFHRLGIETNLTTLPVLDTCTEVTAQLCQIPGGRGGKFKLPTLTELHEYLFGSSFGDAHNATADVEATTRCFFELLRKQVYSVEELQAESNYLEIFNKANPTTIEVIGLKHLNLKKESEKIRRREAAKETEDTIDVFKNTEILKEASFVHLHNHTQFSVLQSTIQVGGLVQAAAEGKMPAVALTDTGNMMAAFHFVSAVSNHNKSARAANEEAIEKGETPKEIIVKPIVGCEFYVCEDHTDKTRKDNGYQIVLLAKNKKGYHNLAKMSSIAFVDGFYYVPRIDKKSDCTIQRRSYCVDWK